MARAEMRVEEFHGVWGFSLIINGNNYGHYPFNGVNDKAVAEQMISMSVDASNYGSSEISFSLLNTVPDNDKLIKNLEESMSK